MSELEDEQASETCAPEREGSNPFPDTMQIWLNWQKHFPAKEGPGDRHVGSSPTVCAGACPADAGRRASKEKYKRRYGQEADSEQAVA